MDVLKVKLPSLLQLGPAIEDDIKSDLAKWHVPDS
jgi:hypothetical protein